MSSTSKRHQNTPYSSPKPPSSLPSSSYSFMSMVANINKDLRHLIFGNNPVGAVETVEAKNKISQGSKQSSPKFSFSANTSNKLNSAISSVSAEKNNVSTKILTPKNSEAKSVVSLSKNNPPSQINAISEINATNKINPPSQINTTSQIRIKSNMQFKGENQNFQNTVFKAEWSTKSINAKPYKAKSKPTFAQIVQMNSTNSNTKQKKAQNKSQNLQKIENFKNPSKIQNTAQNLTQNLAQNMAQNLTQSMAQNISQNKTKTSQFNQNLSKNTKNQNIDQNFQPKKPETFSFYRKIPIDNLAKNSSQISAKDSVIFKRSESNFSPSNSVQNSFQNSSKINQNLSNFNQNNQNLTNFNQNNQNIINSSQKTSNLSNNQNLKNISSFNQNSQIFPNLKNSSNLNQNSLNLLNLNQKSPKSLQNLPKLHQNLSKLSLNSPLSTSSSREESSFGGLSQDRFFKDVFSKEFSEESKVACELDELNVGSSLYKKTVFGGPISQVAPIGTPKASVDFCSEKENTLTDLMSEGKKYDTKFLEKNGFLIVTHLVKTAAADQGGLAVGDIIVRFGEIEKEDFKKLEQLSNFVQIRPNKKINVIVLRQDESNTEFPSYICKKLNFVPLPSKDIRGGGVIGAVINVWPVPIPQAE